jgi:hypothetical protein
MAVSLGGDTPAYRIVRFAASNALIMQPVKWPKSSLEARLRYAAGEREFSRLASDYGVSRSAIANAVLGYTFKHLPMPPKGHSCL